MFAVETQFVRCLLLAGGLLLGSSAVFANDAQRAAEAAAAAAEAIEFTESELAELEGAANSSDSDETYSDENGDEGSDEVYVDEGSYNTSYSSDPVRVETSVDFLGEMRMNYITIRAKEDLVVLQGLTINRGNCGYTLSGRMDAPFPVNIAFGNGARYLIKCSTVLEVTVNTNYGEHTYQFNQP